jgi:hypothetical protein
MVRTREIEPSFLSYRSTRLNVGKSALGVNGSTFAVTTTGLAMNHITPAAAMNAAAPIAARPFMVNLPDEPARQLLRTTLC